jgi:hypothetical protein
MSPWCLRSVHRTNLYCSFASMAALLAEGSQELAKAFVDENFHVLRGCKEPIRLFSLRREPKSVQRAVNSLVRSRPADEFG